MATTIPLGKVKVFKRGHSAGLVISKTILNIIELSLGDEVELIFDVTNRQLKFQLPLVEVDKHKL